jgi:hypothetical protein
VSRWSNEERKAPLLKGEKKKKKKEKGKPMTEG